MTFYKSQRWHSGEKRSFRLNVRRVAAAAAFASAEHFQSENALAPVSAVVIRKAAQPPTADVRGRAWLRPAGVLSCFYEQNALSADCCDVKKTWLQQSVHKRGCATIFSPVGSAYPCDDRSQQAVCSLPHQIFRACLFGPEMPAGRPIGGLPVRGVKVLASPQGLWLCGFFLLAERAFHGASKFRLRPVDVTCACAAVVRTFSPSHHALNESP